MIISFHVSEHMDVYNISATDWMQYGSIISILGCSIIAPMFHIHYLLNVYFFIISTSWRSLGRFKQINIVSEVWEFWTSRLLSHFVHFGRTTGILARCTWPKIYTCFISYLRFACGFQNSIGVRFHTKMIKQEAEVPQNGDKRVFITLDKAQLNV
jgi:hypothetical protein